MSRCDCLRRYTRAAGSTPACEAVLAKRRHADRIVPNARVLAVGRAVEELVCPRRAIAERTQQRRKSVRAPAAARLHAAQRGQTSGPHRFSARTQDALRLLEPIGGSQKGAQFRRSTALVSHSRAGQNLDLRWCAGVVAGPSVDRHDGDRAFVDQDIEMVSQGAVGCI